MRYRDDQLTERVIHCVVTVHRTLGPGFVEEIYRRAMLIELKNEGLSAEVEKAVSIYYKGITIGKHRLDLLVEGRLIVELKTVEALGKAQYDQVRSCLKASGFDTALLVNFAGERADFRRVRRPASRKPAEENDARTNECR